MMPREVARQVRLAPASQRATLGIDRRGELLWRAKVLVLPLQTALSRMLRSDELWWFRVMRNCQRKSPVKVKTRHSVVIDGRLGDKFLFVIKPIKYRETMNVSKLEAYKFPFLCVRASPNDALRFPDRRKFLRPNRGYFVSRMFEKVNGGKTIGRRTAALFDCNKQTCARLKLENTLNWEWERHFLSSELNLLFKLKTRKDKIFENLARFSWTGTIAVFGAINVQQDSSTKTIHSSLIPFVSKLTQSAFRIFVFLVNVSTLSHFPWQRLRERTQAFPLQRSSSTAPCSFSRQSTFSSLNSSLISSPLPFA